MSIADILGPRSIEEMIEEQVRKEGGLKTKPIKPLGAPVLAQSHTPIYKMHRYWARRPHNVFAHIIQHYTNPGDLVLDPFCGGGVTVVESLRLRRRVVGVDINPLATWITQVEVEPVDLDELEATFNEWYAWCVEKITPLFQAQCGKCGKDATAEWFEWSNVVVCPVCGYEVVLAEAEKERNAFYICTNPRCRSRFQPTGLDRMPDKMVNVKTKCAECGVSDIHKPLPSDIELAKQIEKDEVEIVTREKLFIPDDEFPDMDLARDHPLFRRGIKTFKDFFSPRQRISIAKCRKFLEIKSFRGTLINSLIHIFTGSLRYTNKMVFRNEVWRGDNPLEWPGHMYWLPYSYLEASPLFSLTNRKSALNRGKKWRETEIGDYYKKPSKKKPWEGIICNASCWLVNNSSDDIPLEAGSVDVVITDPPFGGNVQYLELSDFYLVWLRKLVDWGGLTEKSKEAIQTRHQGFEGAKDLNHYENMLTAIFRECHRVLKENSWMVMTFHNTDIYVWMALHRAAHKAGFRLPSYEESLSRGMIYQPAIKNYTQTIHQRATGSLLGDFILSFKRSEMPTSEDLLRQQLSLEQERHIHDKCAQIIKYHGGLDEPSLWSAILPFLMDNGYFHRIANFNFKMLLANGPFVYLKDYKKWYLQDMVENGRLRTLEYIPAKEKTYRLIFSYLRDNKQATMDELLQMVYSQLVNAQLPQIETIKEILDKYCHKKYSKNLLRDVYIWAPGKKSLIEKEIIKAQQNSLVGTKAVPQKHDDIILHLAREAVLKEFDVHAGKTEQRKSQLLRDLSLRITGAEVGLSPETFKYIREIDLLILQNNNIRAAVEVVMTISTLNKALNDRFRNLLHLAPNLNIPLVAVVRDEDYPAAVEELCTPINLEDGLPDKVRLVQLSQLSAVDSIEVLL
ncbi:MAG: hypothetical protein FJY65_08335 [Calditrichaeota bacterium]|nr:hypothetical protein [Calditrichota bacterium]